MSTHKHALLSPAINAQQTTPSDDDQRQLFESKFGEMAYQAFGSKHPDLLENVVTFKILDADIEAGSAVGAFILENDGNYLYVPATLSENALKPFDMMYVKSKDIFLPLSAAWIEEINKTALSSMGESEKIPDTVATDVDIRNIVVPPTTGRYSYASADLSPAIKLAAEASEPLGRKLANMDMGMAAGAPTAAPGAPAGAPAFNPQIWATFVDHYQKINGTTPGQALDSGGTDIDALGKMYKSHMKTWDAPAAPSPEAAAPAAPAPMPGMGMGGGMGMAPKMGGAREEMADQAYRTLGQGFDDFTRTVGRGAGIGAGVGATQAAMDQELADVPSAALQGAVGGAMAGPAGKALGKAVGNAHPNVMSVTEGGRIGGLVGALGGGYTMSRQNPNTVSGWTAPSQGAMQEYYQEHPQQMMRMGSVDDGLRDMLKHAKAKNVYTPKLLDFLHDAPNVIKTAFANVLKANPGLLTKTANIYGGDALVQALQHKTAAATDSRGGALHIADKKTSATEVAESFGTAAATAFQGVLLRGYYYKDTRPKLNLAMQVQHYHDFHDAKEPGVYRIYDLKGKARPALVLYEPLDLLSSDRVTYPRDQNKVKPLKLRVPSNGENPEPNGLSTYDLTGSASSHAHNDVERSHDETRLAIFGNGDYIRCSHIMGEQVTEVLLKGTPLYRKAFTDQTAKPSKGKGIFVCKKGAHYTGSLPVEISEMSSSTGGVIRGKLGYPGGSGMCNFVIDPRSPMGKPKRLRQQNLVIIPASWRWVPVKEEQSSCDYLNNPEALSTIALDAMGSMGVHEAVARKAGQSMYAINGSKTLDKKAALEKLATDCYISAHDAEAMLKIAEEDNICRAHIVAEHHLPSLQARIKTAQGAVPQTPMGGPPAMQQPPAQPAQPPAQPGMPPQPGMEQPPAPQEPSAVDQAFGESVDGVQQQMDQLQAQLDVLMSVQQRAQEIETEQGGMGDPAMQGGDPAMQGDPAMAGGEGEMPMEEEQPPLPIMHTEEPTSSEIEQQINPEFLEQAAGLEETGAFDAGAVGSLSNSPSLKMMSSEYAANLENSVDDLGRTLLTLYMQEHDLKEQLGDETFVELETQLRDTFRGLGELTLSLSHNTSMLDQNATA